MTPEIDFYQINTSRGQKNKRITCTVELCTRRKIGTKRSFSVSFYNDKKNLIRQLFLCIAHTFATSGISIHTATNWAGENPFVLSYSFSNSLLEHLPFYCVVLRINVSKSAFIWSNCRHFPTTIVNSVTRYQ